jgi:hypothetical protein
MAALFLRGVTCVSAQERSALVATRASLAPKIDGILDDQVWTIEPVPSGQWISYNPLHGEQSPERTDVRVAYDDRFIYVAFRCFSDNPHQIRTTVSRRDNAFNDDWVGLSLDSTGSKQSAYEFFVNPSGVQMDAVNTTSAGERFETDLVWASAGSLTADGYIVEIALPLQTIRFSASAEVSMGVLFFRHMSRSGKSYSWPELPPGESVLNAEAPLIFRGLVPRRIFELLPSATLPLSQTRASADRWNAVEGKPDFGVSAKYAVTSEVTFDATVNPDFSQVESDAFQVQVNQRFPIFFSEKRPFFMEGLGLFNLAGGESNYNVRSAVHTRRIVNPAWGAKLIGTAGRLSFGFLEASDEEPSDPDARGQTIEGKDKVFTIGRATYGLGGSDYVGAIVTDTEHAGRHNRVAGGDVSWKPTPSQRLLATYLYSQTGVASDAGASGAGVMAQHVYKTRRTFVSAQLEHYDTHFQMDTAFYNRTGFTVGILDTHVNFYPEKAKRFGLVRVYPSLFVRAGRDRMQGGNEDLAVVATSFNFQRQGFLRVLHGRGHEPWAGKRFRAGDALGAYGTVQLFRWLYIGGNMFHRTWAIFYDPVDPFQGRSSARGFEITWQPNEHFNQKIEYNAVRFDGADTGARIFNVDIINTKTIYQFDKHFLVRLVEQFDSSRRQLLTDVLASYELVPGTVFHAGYGSLYEQRLVLNGQLLPNVSRTGRYLTVNRGLFFKASYLHRF